MKKIIYSFIFSLCLMQHLQVISMLLEETQTALVEANVINLSPINKTEKDIFPENYLFNHILRPITTTNWLSKRYHQQNITHCANQLHQQSEKTPLIVFASEKMAHFALHYIAQNPSIKFDALILQNAQLDNDHYILNLHRNIPAHIPVIFFTTECGIEKTRIQQETGILYAKVKQRSETESNTYLIPPQSINDLGTQHHLNNILIHKNLLNRTPMLTDMQPFQPAPSTGITNELKQIEQKEKMRICGIIFASVLGAGFLIYLMSILKR